MKSSTMRHKIPRSFLFVLALFVCTSTNAGYNVAYSHGGGYEHDNGYNPNGGYNHDGDDNNYNNNYYRGNDWNNSGVVIDVPSVNSLAPGCSTVKQCDNNGNCVLDQICN